MALQVRIDDRLMHGQVAHGVLPVLGTELVIVADDHAATDEWERETYEASAPVGVEVRVLGLEPAVHALAGAARGEAPVLLLVRGPAELLALGELGLDAAEAAVGGLHAAPGRTAFAADLQIGPAEARAFRALGRTGVRCYYQPLPTDRPSELPDLTMIMDEESRT